MTSLPLYRTAERALTALATEPDASVSERHSNLASLRDRIDELIRNLDGDDE